MIKCSCVNPLFRFNFFFLFLYVILFLNASHKKISSSQSKNNSLNLMQVKEIIDIVKVLERRITKLESRVSELEYSFEDANISNDSINNKLNISDISLQTIKYNNESLRNENVKGKSSSSLSNGKNKKIIYDKKALLNIKDTNIGSNKINETSNSSYIKYDWNKSSKSNKEEKLSCSNIQKEIKSIERYDAGKTSKLKSQLRTNVSPTLATMIQSSSSSTTTTTTVLETTKDAIAIKNSIDILSEDISIPSGKTEMHYGLLVQFPPDHNIDT